jgi:hypothetical protein
MIRWTVLKPERKFDWDANLSIKEKCYSESGVQNVRVRIVFVRDRTVSRSQL